ncbi:hypothetical protein CFIMG_001999RA [Ceratocystis fimbriata CBS 114723]|uniref:ABM domain-containing protein n=1 Tax=Ceratocystis fimbriata CBS 114723 TaxID=1035309 RepID=A0A2C5X473_9PEZI|nr:hypothetical protein CFIMG_001999RA [Ceratocystis fimbriata CBS 114723]
MTSSLVFEYFLFEFLEPAGSSLGYAPPESITTILHTIAAQPEIDNGAVYLGQYLESPSTWLLIVPWVSQDAYVEFKKSPRYAPIAEPLASKVQVLKFYMTSLGPDAYPALESKCTELLTTYGVDTDYVDNGREFLDRMEAYGMDGYHGGAIGKTLDPIAQAEEEKAQAACFVLGWESKEAHLDNKAKTGNPIIANLSLITGGTRALVMYHVNFTKYTKQTL